MEESLNHLAGSTVLGIVRRNIGPLLLGAGLAVAFLAATTYVAGLSPAVSVALVATAALVGAGMLWVLSGRRIDVQQPLPRRRLAVSLATGVVAVALGIQAIPYGRDHSNPPITAEPAWDSPQTRELTKRACFDCHSNEVVYPWYSNVAPFSWAVAAHISAGRDKVNYSEWDRPQRDADESADTVRDGEMPPGFYNRLGTHPDARLTAAEKAALIRGLEATFGSG